MSRPFQFEPAPFVPFRDADTLAKVRSLSGEELTRHDNPDLRIRILDDDLVSTYFIADMLSEIVSARDEGRRVNLLIPNPNPGYRHLARYINALGIECSHVTTFNLDEWADQDGNVADERYAQSFVAATKRYLYAEIDEDLRMPESQIVYPTTENIGNYSDLLLEAGGIDVSYTGPGWSGHMAFVDPDVPEWSADLEEFLEQGARITSLNPLTIAQNSLHGGFGSSGDLASVPPKAATVGPLDVARARRRVEMHAITTAGSFVTWQRMISRLTLHGPITPQVPSSIFQRLGADVYISRTLAAPIEADPLVQY